MPPRSHSRRWFAGLLVLAVTAAGVMYLRRAGPPLPAAVHSAALPAAFAQALAEARAAVQAHPRDETAWRKLARLYQANRFYAEARICVAAVATLGDGLSARDYYYQAEMAQQEGDLAGAIEALRATLAQEPTYLPARVQLADALFKSGHEDESAEAYRAVVKLESNHLQASVGLARVELLQGQESAAIARLEALMGAHPEATAGAALLAQLFTRRGETARAAAMTQWSQQQREPVLVDPWLDDLLSDCYDTQRLTLKFEEYLFTGQLEASRAYLDRVAVLDPQAWTPHLLRGWSEARRAHHAEAVKEFRQALAKGGDPEKICPLLATSLIAGSNLPEASRILAESVSQAPESIPLLTAYSEVAVKLGDETLATDLLRRILVKEPYLYTPNLNLARILWARGNRDDAVACLQRIAKGFPDDVASRGLLGQYYLEKSDPGSAIEPLEQARAQSASGTPAAQRLTEMLTLAYLQVGAAAVARGERDVAARRFAQATALAPADSKTQAFIASTWVDAKVYDRATAALAILAQLEPTNPTIELSWGDVLLQAGEGEQARIHWERARALAAPGDADLLAALAARLRGEVKAEALP